jgi:hypothetical protein
MTQENHPPSHPSSAEIYDESAEIPEKRVMGLSAEDAEQEHREPERERVVLLWKINGNTPLGEQLAVVFPKAKQEDRKAYMAAKGLSDEGVPSDWDPPMVAGRHFDSATRELTAADGGYQLTLSMLSPSDGRSRLGYEGFKAEISSDRWSLNREKASSVQLVVLRPKAIVETPEVEEVYEKPFEVIATLGIDPQDLETAARETGINPEYIEKLNELYRQIKVATRVGVGPQDLETAAREAGINPEYIEKLNELYHHIVNRRVEETISILNGYDAETGSLREL